MTAPRTPGFSFQVLATDGHARRALLTTPHAEVPLPTFMPVGTQGSVKTLTPDEVAGTGARVVLGNTYHLMLRPGADVIDGLGGLHGFAAWDRHVLTDSGGFQIYKLEPKVTDEGATFRSIYDGSLHELTPESAVEIQRQLGADIQMVLDVCPALPAPVDAIRDAVKRTSAWAGRARGAFLEGVDVASAAGRAPAQFGIVQGGVDAALRRESAERTVEIGFDGYGIGGLSVGEERDEMLPALDAAVENLPGDQPRYLMGVGDPIGFVEGIARGVDMFDCVLATRLARHGTILTSSGRLNLRNAAHTRSDRPLDQACGCAVCARWSRAYLRHLLSVQEPTAARLLTIHNLHWCLRLMERARAAIRAGRFDALRREIGAIWG
jgi:queuine tRNA-ribosyltransferase